MKRYIYLIAIVCFVFSCKKTVGNKEEMPDEIENITNKNDINKEKEVTINSVKKDSIISKKKKSISKVKDLHKEKKANKKRNISKVKDVYCLKCNKPKDANCLLYCTEKETVYMPSKKDILEKRNNDFQKKLNLLKERGDSIQKQKLLEVSK